MANEHGEWIMYGVNDNDPHCIKTVDALVDYVKEVGFLPLFKNTVPGFSVEERTVPRYWWSENIERDPWEWRELIARSGKVAYGKFFDKKAGFISLEWLPYFANWRRDGYDFDSLWEEGKASRRQKKLMDLFEGDRELFSFEAKKLAGFGTDGEKNFEGTVTELQMHTYLTVKDFRCRTNKQGKPYGWAIAVYTKPESLWGYELLSSAYGEEPEKSRERIFDNVRKNFPSATEAQIKKILK